MTTHHTYQIDVELRKQKGTRPSRQLRRADRIPAIIYGADEEPVQCSVEETKLLRALSHESFLTAIITLNIEGKKVKAVLKALQRHAYKPKLIHADFLRISETHKLTMRIPLHFIGEDKAPGVKLREGIVSHMMTDVEIKCLPADLPEFITVDLSKLDVEQSFHLSDLPLPKGVELSHQVTAGEDNDLPIAAIHIPRAASAEEESSAPVATPVPAINAGAPVEAKK